MDGGWPITKMMLQMKPQSSCKSMICYYHQRSEPKALRLALSGTRAEVMVRWWPKATTHAERAKNSIMQNQINDNTYVQIDQLIFPACNSLSALIGFTQLQLRQLKHGRRKHSLFWFSIWSLLVNRVFSPWLCQANPRPTPKYSRSQLEAGPTKPISLGRDIPINPSYYSYTPRYCQPHVSISHDTTGSLDRVTVTSIQLVFPHETSLFAHQRHLEKIGLSWSILGSSQT